MKRHFSVVVLSILLFTTLILPQHIVAAADPYNIPDFQTAFPCYYSYAADLLGFTQGSPPCAATSTGTLAVSTANVPPNTDTCNGKYTQELAKIPSHQNFGDPKCENAANPAVFKNNYVHNLLQQLDAAHADIWFLMITRESSYDPNAYLANSTSHKGAYGLFQMNPSGSYSIGDYKYDVGNVYWQTQAYNAITFLKVSGHNSCDYWQSAIDMKTCFTVK